MPKMHADEIDITLAIVQQLIKTQYPQWGTLPLTPVTSAGTDHALYRLGTDKVIRLPRLPQTQAQVTKEQRWLPQLAPHVPLKIPKPIEQGTPDTNYPFHWSIYNWLMGTPATRDQLKNPDDAARTLAQFILALQQVDTTNAPTPAAHNFFRGVPLAQRDQQTRAAIASLDGMIDTHLALKAWENACNAPIWEKAPVWIHGDLQSGNILAHEGNINAVIDFGAMAIGDPACDLQIAWNLFTPDMRNTFYEAIQVDAATWQRGRGWALSVALIALPYYQHTNPTLANISRYAIQQVLADTSST